MKKKIIKHYRIIRSETPKMEKDQNKKEEKKVISQVDNYVCYYELFKSLEK